MTLGIWAIGFIAAAVIVAAVWLWNGRGRGAGWLALPLVFVFLGLARGDANIREWSARDQAVAEAEGKRMELTGRIAAIEVSDGKTELTIRDGEPFPCVLVSLKQADASNDLRIGMTAAVFGSVKPFAKARNPGEFDSRTYYHALGVDCRFYGETLRITDRRFRPIPDLLRCAREYAKRVVDRVAEPKDAGIYRAAVLGDKKGLDQEIRDLYQENGIAHLLAISGLHLSIVGMGLYRLLRKAGLGFGGSGVCATCLIVLYGILTGGSPSVVRAVMMMMAAFLAACLGRTYDLLSAASLSLLLLSVQSPLFLSQGGVLLSFGAVFAIGAAAPILAGWFGREHKWAGAAAASVAIQLVTLPVIAYHFFQFPVYGMVLNLFVIPLMGVVVCSGIGIIMFGSMSYGAGVMAAGAGHDILAFYEWLCTRAAALPYHMAALKKPGFGTVTAYYAILAASLAGMAVMTSPSAEQNNSEKNAGSFGAGRTAARILTVVFLFLCCFSLLCPGPVRGLNVVFLDVGQGDGCLIQTGRTVILVDGGSTSEQSLGEYCLEPCIKSYGISTIDYIFISHGDKDHLSGVQYLLESCETLEIGCLALPYHGRDDEALLNLKELAAKRGIDVKWIRAGEFLVSDGLIVSCIYPGIEDVPSDTNEESEVLLMDYGDCHLLFTGDMSKAGEERLLKRMREQGQSRRLKDVRILKAAHHGSKYSSCEAFLDALGARWAVISYGEDNSYGHPHKEAVERMEERGIGVLRTAEHGAVMMHTDGKRVWWQFYLEGGD